MLRTLHVINNLGIGGAEYLVKEILPALHQRGFDCHLLLLDGTETNFKKELAERYHIPVFSVGTNVNIYNPLMIFRLVPFIRNYEIVHVHLFPAQYWVALAKTIFFLKIMLVTTEHSSHNRRRKILIFKFFDRFIYRKYSSIITVSETAAENLRIHLNDFSSKIKIINNGANLNSVFDAIPYTKAELLPGSNESIRLIINVARFFAAKDHTTLINSMLSLPHHIHLILVGDGELKKFYIDMVRDLNLSDRVHFFGIRHDVYRILKSADIIVMSSFYEGLSVASIEGMASGKPFVASDVTGLREIVRDAGILFERGNSIQLAKIIMNLLEDDAFYKSTAEKCLNRSKEYDISRTADSYADVYRSLFSG